MIDMPRPLFPAPDPTMFERRMSIQSFTRLQRHRRAESESFGDLATFGDDEAADAIPAVDEPLQGAVFGELVHRVFERLDFAAVARAETPERLEDGPASKILDEEIHRFLPQLTARVPIDQLAPLCRQFVRKLVWTTLRTPLGPLGTSLCRIGADDRLEELGSSLCRPTISRVGSGGGKEEWFVTGYMKTSSSAAATGFMAVRLEDEHAPRLLERRHRPGDGRGGLSPTVSALCPGSSIAGCGAKSTASGAAPGVSGRIGGVFYLFLRGMNTDATTRLGVFFVPGSAVDLMEARP